MASAKQACQALDIVLRLPPNTAAGYAHRIRAQGLIPATQGRPEQLDSTDIAAILIGTVTSSATVADYLYMPSVAAGEPFGAVLARFISQPNDMIDLRIDAAAPGAVLTYRGPDHGVQTVTFEPLERRHRPAFRREVTIGPDILINLAHALAAAPEVRAGRPATRDRYSRMERAVVY